jgi:alginate O-acetyltransferase complex protein AlgI
VLFNSLEFPVYLAVVLFAHFLLIPATRVAARKWLLLLASYGFYASWNPFFVLLLGFSTAVDYFAALAIERTQSPGSRRALLLLSVSTNLGLLGFFKYGRFATESALATVGLSLPEGSTLLEVALPVGISFYTFQSLSYSIDVYRGRQEATRSALDLALYVSFFPQLVAGPIVRAGQLLPQLRGARFTTALDVEEGLMRIGVGLVKKVVLADTLAMYVDMVFEAPGLYGGPEVVLALYAFSFQAYFDFSGYTDIAIGLGRLFGVRLPENFDHPYRAASIREFWQRWHITLSTWLRDYLYVSLGGNRHGRARTVLNLFLTMLLGGLWHGAGWGFVIWGAYQGVMLGVHRIWLWAVGERPPRSPRWLRQLATFQLLAAGWILFRAPTIDVSWELVKRLPVMVFHWELQSAQVLLVLLLALLLHFGTEARQLGMRLLRLPGWIQGTAYAAAAALIYLASGRTGEFIYFQF